MTTKANDGLEQVLDQLENQGDGTPPKAAEIYSPVLTSLPKDRRPDPLPVCAACPSSMWFASTEGLKGYCRVMHSLTWTSEEPEPIVACDGITLPMG